MRHKIPIALFLTVFCFLFRPGDAQASGIHPYRALLAADPVSWLAAAEAGSCDETLDTVLRLGPHDGIQYDRETRSWYFVGIVDDMAVEHLGGTDVTLVRVRYQYNDTIRVVWVTAGAQTIGKDFLSAGDWETPGEMRALLQPDRTYVRVYAGGPDEPVATPEGIDWTLCDSPWCRFARNVEDLWTLEGGFSTFFVTSGMGSSWWPWGYLPWHIEVGRSNVGWCDYGN